MFQLATILRGSYILFIKIIEDHKKWIVLKVITGYELLSCQLHVKCIYAYLVLKHTCNF
jgi:hypothetical protein